MRRVVALGLSLALVLVVAAPAAASSTQSFPAGWACSFGLTVESGAGGPQNVHQFTNGFISAGRGNDLTFTNDSSGDTLWTRATGAVTRVAFHEGGAYTMTMIGNNVLILFPSDTPAGPSTTLYSGRVVVDVDALGNFTVRSVSGTSLDVCAALS